MTGDSDFDKLQAEGDALEILICREFDDLQKVLLPYARVWSRHIYPRRIGNGTFLRDESQPFGGCHYTALVRLHHALVAKRNIVSLCEESELFYENKATWDDYSRLLQLHAACATFWDNFGASIDNFVHAREEAKKLFAVPIEKRKENPACPKCGLKPEPKKKLVARTLSPYENPLMHYAFERRHQFIHSILVPARIENGKLRFNVRHYDDTSTNWSRDIQEMKDVAVKIEEDWEKVLTEYGNTWAGFFSWMQQQDVQAPKPVEVQLNVDKVVRDIGQYEAPKIISGSLNVPPISGSGE